MRGTTGRSSYARPAACTADRARQGSLSTCAVYEIAALTCADVAVPRIHGPYYDYESYI